MILNEKRKINSLKRRLGYSVIVIFILIYWIIQKNYDIDYYESHIDMIFHENLEKDDEIQKLKYKLDSIEKQKLKEIDNNKFDLLINRKKSDKKEDTIKIVKYPPEQESNEPLDTLNR
jgi:hypothetical protein